ncbi:hypothetical protein HD806DRAFT_533103 [Xylariaceae sp. AK1471]|nr:hypothetical protein HD806DRAFT_533103 [Xylariaceae sp. AK1471]
MENITSDFGRALPTEDQAKRFLDSNPQRPTHLSLPRLIINPHRGPAPEEIPANKINWFMEFIVSHQQAPPITLLPLPILPASPTHNFNSLSPVSLGSYQAHQTHLDPYLVDLPTPTTIQFTEIEAIELEQWIEIKGSMSKAHFEALNQLLEDPSDTKAKEEVRKLRCAREENASAIAQIHDRRQIRRNFRKDFNRLFPGW